MTFKEAVEALQNPHSMVYRKTEKGEIVWLVISDKMGRIPYVTNGTSLVPAGDFELTTTDWVVI